MADNPKISIIIVNHFTDDIIPECLERIAQSKIESPIEVIIVDNPSAEIPELTIEKLSITRIPTGKRLGFGEACNLGATQARGEYLLLLNPDVFVGADTISTLSDCLDHNTEAGAATARLTNPDGSFQPSCRRFPTMGNLIFSQRSVVRGLKRNIKSNYTLPDYAEAIEVEACAAAAMMMRRSLFERLGGFDKSFFMYLEDTDLCRRIKDSGFSIWFLPEAEAVHLWGRATGRYRFARIVWHHISMYKYFRKHSPGIATIIVLPVLLLVNGGLLLIRELFRLRA